MSEEVVRAVANGVSSSEEEEGGEVDQEVGRENLLFAPDSSDDEEEEDVEKEIQFEDSDSDSSDGAGNVAPEEFDFMRKQEEKMVSLEDGPISSPSDNEGREEDVNKEGNGSLQRVASLSSSDGEEKAGNEEEVDGGKANDQMENTDPQSTLVESLEQTTENQLINISAGSPEDVRESPIRRMESDFVPPNNIEETHSIVKDSPSNIEDSHQSNIDRSDQHQNDQSSSTSSDSSPVIGKALPDTNCQIRNTLSGGDQLVILLNTCKCSVPQTPLFPFTEYFHNYSYSCVQSLTEKRHCNYVTDPMNHFSFPIRTLWIDPLYYCILPLFFLYIHTTRHLLIDALYRHRPDRP